MNNAHHRQGKRPGNNFRALESTGSGGSGVLCPSESSNRIDHDENGAGKNCLPRIPGLVQTRPGKV
jgi:hypothetical protein